MTEYIVKLSEQETLSLRQLVAQQGFEPLVKLLQGISLQDQSIAMACKGTSEERLLALSDAQATARVVSKITRQLFAYRESFVSAVPMGEEDPMGLNIFERKM